MSKTKTVYPVEGRYLNGVPHVEHECDDKLCIESGAFTEKPPPKAAKPKSEGPADAGPLDSEEN
jgi:hypothetical protein